MARPEQEPQLVFRNSVLVLLKEVSKTKESLPPNKIHSNTTTLEMILKLLNILTSQINLMPILDSTAELVRILEKEMSLY